MYACMHVCMCLYVYIYTWVYAWFGIGMPKGTPPDVINKVNAAVNATLAEPAMRARLADLGGVPIPGTPADFGKVIVAETEKWAKVINDSGVKLD